MQSESLVQAIRAEAVRLGSDLVGFAPVSRWAKAPVEHSPQGVWPAARNVIVCGIHFLDAPTELGAEKDPRDPGPAMTEMNVSAMLHDVAWHVCRLLQQQGHQALFVRQSGAWRYRAANGDRGWVGDICHYYAAAAAGLGEIGWNNLCLTPQFGPRQRFVSILTDAELPATPLYDGPPLCDRCKLCAKHCPTQSFTKDISGDMLCIEVENKRWEFPDRNLWRCAIGENFMLDVFLDEWKDRRVDEKLIVEAEERAVREHPEWITGWKMGMCLKHCVPPQRRYFDRNYCKAPRRRRDITPALEDPAIARLRQRLVDSCAGWDIDMIAAAPAAAFREVGLDLQATMPDAASAVVIGLGYPEQAMLNSDYAAAKAEIMVGKLLQEEFGFSALPRSGIDDQQAAITVGLAYRSDDDHRTDSVEDAARSRHTSLRLDIDDSAVVSARFGHHQIWRTILTSAPLPAFKADTTPAEDLSRDLSDRIREVAREAGAALVGFAPAARLDALAPVLDALLGDPDHVTVEDTTMEPLLAIRKRLWGGQGYPFAPEIRKAPLRAKSPCDYLPNARSVIVVGVELLHASIDAMTTPDPAKAGHFHTHVHEEAFCQLTTVLRKLARLLQARSHKAVPTRDLNGLASRVSGGDVDLTACNFAALAAGLGDLGLNGFVLTPAHGSHQRFACIVTDAELAYDPVYSGPSLCRRCGTCIGACPVKALRADATQSVAIDGRTFTWAKRDRMRCDFAQRYGLVAEEGGGYIGCKNVFAVPATITPEYVSTCISQADRIQRPAYTPTVERCFTHCAAHREVTKTMLGS